MKLISTLCCSALINPFNPMVEALRNEYLLTFRLLHLITYFMAGAITAQAQLSKLID
jgi:hypothetical protein